MSSFKGQEDYSIDAKGRVSIPAKMRKNMTVEAKDTFVLTRGLEKCIVAYPLDIWDKYETQFGELNQFNEKNRYFLRVFLRWSENVTIDQQQRINVPKQLLEYSGIDGKVTIVGVSDHIEFWNPDIFNEYMDSHEEPYHVVAEQVMSPANK